MKVDVVARIAEVSARDWDACAGEHNPFVEHAFLHALEEGGCVGAGTGWLPCHLVAKDAGAAMKDAGNAMKDAGAAAKDAAGKAVDAAKDAAPKK